MTTTTVELGNTVAVRRTGSRIGALAGVAFALCLFFGVAMLEIPRHASDSEIVAWWADKANQRASVVSMYLFVLAGIAFLVFLVKLRTRLLAAEGGDGELSSFAFVAGTVFVAMLFVAGAARGAIGFAVLSPTRDDALPGADTLRYVPQIGYAITNTGGMLAAALTMATTSWLVFRTDVFGRWLGWLGAVATLAIVAGCAVLSAAFAIPALLAWAVATSVALWRSAS